MLKCPVAYTKAPGKGNKNEVKKKKKQVMKLQVSVTQKNDPDLTMHKTTKACVPLPSEH